MICELFPFQKQAVNEMRLRVAMALNNYRMLKIPQVVSLQAPTGSGKTIIMSALIEDIFYGSEQFTEQPEAIFVWLSDSPQLNEQSKQKIELKADKVRMDQCVVISDESFDREILEDGHIYFLNTQKLGKAGNLSRHSDTRQYTIWETLKIQQEKKLTVCISLLMRHTAVCRDAKREQLPPSCSVLSRAAASRICRPFRSSSE